MQSIKIIRMVRLKNLELFMLRDGYYGKIISYMLFIDLNRPGTLEDFPYLKGIEDEKEFSRSNFIKTIFFSKESLFDEMKEELVSIAGGFLENKDDCHWNADFEILSDDNYNTVEIVKLIETFLTKKYNLFIKLSEIPTYKFNSLSQD